MTALKPGLRLKSGVCSAEVMIVKGLGEASLTCGGVPMLGLDESADGAQATAAEMNGCQVGKRYVNGDHSLEVLRLKFHFWCGANARHLPGVRLRQRCPSKARP